MYGENYSDNHGLSNKDFPIWVAQKIKETFYSFYYPLTSNDNIICSKKEKLSFDYRYNDYELLIIGGGGSTNKWLDKWKDYDFEYDWVWSLNNFHKNDILKKRQIDLVSLGPEVDFQDKDLLNYLMDFRPYVGIELHQKWSRPEKFDSLIRDVNKFYEYSDKKFTFQTKYFSVLGSGARLILLACELGVKSISIIGFDGPQNIWAGNHAFEEGKNFMTYRCQGIPKEQVIKMFENEYNFFWNYCHITYPNTKIYTIDDYYRYHKVLKELHG